MSHLRASALVLAAGLSATGTAHAAASHRSAGSTGIGLGGGTASAGISAKHWLTKGTAIQGVVGSYGRWEAGSGIGLSADYLFEGPAIATGEVLDLGWNLGLGAGLGIGNELGVGVSGVAGLEFAFVPAPIDLTLEYRPTLGVAPGLGFDLINFSGHLRWFF